MGHTLRPWRIREWFEGGVVDNFKTVIVDSRGQGICQFMTFGKNKKVQANARLIAAAPDMLELLKEALEGKVNGIPRSETIALIKRIEATQ